jgi:hypothetical protein
MLRFAQHDGAKSSLDQAHEHSFHRGTSIFQQTFDSPRARKFAPSASIALVAGDV